MSGHFSNARHGLVASLLLLAMASTASAQSIIDSRRIEFTPSGDLAALDVKTGTAAHSELQARHLSRRRHNSRAIGQPRKSRAPMPMA